jgi:O-methyltransferase
VRNGRQISEANFNRQFTVNLMKAKSAIRRMVNGLGFEIQRVQKIEEDEIHEEIRPSASYAPWRADQSFREAYQAIRNNTMVDIYRCYELWSLVEQSQKLEGAILEVGVWRGGTGSLIATKANLCGISDNVYLCDTFTGVVKASGSDTAYSNGNGEHSDTSKKLVEKLISRLDLKNVQILQGIFPDDTSRFIKETKFRLAHIDVDIYQSAKDVLEWVWPKMVSGGIVVFDDYGFQGLEGIVKLIDEDKSRNDRIFIYNVNGHAIYVKQ